MKIKKEEEKEEKKFNVVKFGILTTLAITLIFGIVFFLESFKEKDDDNGGEPLQTYNTLKVNCSDDLQVSVYEDGTYSELSKNYEKEMSLKFDSRATTGDGKTFTTTNGSNPTYLSLKLKFTSEKQTNVYLSNLVSLLSYDEEGNKTGLAGMSRISFVSNDQLISTIVLNENYELIDDVVRFSGKREDSYKYNLSSEYTYSEEDYLNQKIIIGSKNLASNKTKMINNSPKLLALEANQPKELTANIWFEATDRENSEYPNNKVNITLDFINFNKNKLGESEQSYLSSVTYDEWGKRLIVEDRPLSTADNLCYSFNGIEFTGPYNETNQLFDSGKYQYIYIRKFETLDTEAGIIYKINLV